MDRRNFLGMAAAGSAALATPALAGGRDKLAKAIADHAVAKNFHGTVLAATGSKVAYHGAFGIADRAQNVPCARGTLYRIASITKLFASVLALRFVERGRLNLDSTIRDHLPAYRGEGAARVTVRQLLNHTSGIANFETVTSFEQAINEGMPAYQLPHTSQALMDGFASGKLVTEPGKSFSYNNADYVILGKIIEALAGKPFDVALREEVLDPLVMRDTGLMRSRTILPGLAPTYFRNGEEPLVNDLPVFWENWYAAGGMYSSAPDLLKFATALYGGRLIAAPQLAALLTPGLDDYGFGLWIASLKVGEKRHRFAQRPGSIMGANALLLRMLDDDVTIVILANTNQADIDAFGFHIARTMLG